MSSSLHHALEMARLELLDMGLRGNTLLNLRHSALTIPVIEEHASEIYRLLVLESRTMRFAAAPQDSPILQDQAEDASGHEPWVALPDPQGLLNVDASDTLLQTRLSAPVLDQRLIKISHAAKSYYEEQGVEILYLALGCLLWSEDANSTPRRAPLVLVPVELQRVAVAEGFKLVFTGADLGPNLTLAAKLKSEFNIQLPTFEQDSLEYTAYVEAVRAAVSGRSHWQVLENEICLGFFSFGKFQMYQDLDPALLQAQPESSYGLLNALFSARLAEVDTAATSLGTPEASVTAPMEAAAPALTALNFVKDSDTSQTQAVMAVVQGSNLVIQGPPGTGKSQTITNIIAELVGRGKKVLFVAEKMAALEVVKRRLDECHLGDAVLELHSHKSQRKAVIDALAQRLELGVPQTPDRSQAIARHQQLQVQLDQYAAAVAKPILHSGLGYVQALANYLKLQQAHPELAAGEGLDFASMRDWRAADFEAAQYQVDAFIAHLQTHGSPHLSLWGNSRLASFSPQQQQAVETQLERLQQSVEQWDNALYACQQLIGQTSGVVPVKVASVAEYRVFSQSVNAAVQAPSAFHLQRVDCNHRVWSTGLMKQWWHLQQQMQALRARHANLLLDQAWTTPVLALRATWLNTADKWWRLMSGEFRAARREFQGLCQRPLPDDPQQVLAVFDDILAWQALNEQSKPWAVQCVPVLGMALTMRDFATQDAVVTWLCQAHEAIDAHQWMSETLLWASQWSHEDRQAIQTHITQLDQTYDTMVQQFSRLAHLAELPDIESWFQRASDWSVLLDQLARARRQTADLYAIARFNQMESQLTSAALQEVARRARQWTSGDAQLLKTTLQVSWYGGLVHEAYRSNPILAQFDRAAHEHAIAEFAALDKALFVYAQERLVLDLHRRLPSTLAVGEMAVLRREMNKKRRHMPLRQLMREAGRVIQQMKPVFMMSPMSVATYLEHGSVEFDVVIFDEASQVRVADALGSLLRAKQAVVVGDSRQMPPTDFFSRSLELDDEQAQASQTADIESILGMFVSQGAPQKMLRWHYRSRHDSLIAVSNQAFYDGRLWIFPTPGVQSAATGLRLHSLPDTHYDRGQTRTNPGEARAVAQAVLRHAQQSPDLSLGVVAFSTAQRDCLLMEIERIRREHPDCEAFFNRQRPDGENFFVKNLENVQGDERDVIFISIGYGRTADGRLVPSFGPINQEGGERRLNVLITRAKLAMDVFCNFTADDLRLEASTPFGVRALHQFLAFAQTRHFPGEGSVRPRETVGAFEQFLSDEIVKLGYRAQPKMGQSGCFIDVAVHDPEVDKRFVLALQTDGESYQSSADARERDRVKPGVLSGFGWQLQPVWSVDWFRTPQQERVRLQQAIETAHRRLATVNAASSIAEPERLDKQPSSVAQDAPAVTPHQRSSLGEPSGSIDPVSLDQAAVIERIAPLQFALNTMPLYQIYTGDLGLPRHQQLHEALPESISASIARLVEHEGPMHLELVARRLADAAGVARLTAKVQQRIEQGVAYGVAAGHFYQTEAFIHRHPEPDVTPRLRTDLPALYRKIEYVSPFEWQAALRQAIRLSHGIQTSEAVITALDMLGFARATAKAKAVVEAQLQVLGRQGKVVVRQGGLQWVDSA